MKKITKNELQQMNDKQDEDFVLINVLAQEDFNKKHIGNSVNIPVGAENFEKQVKNIAGSRKRKIVVYCAGTSCQASVNAAEKLEQDGFGEVYAYEGGTEEWFEKDQNKAA